MSKKRIGPAARQHESALKYTRADGAAPTKPELHRVVRKKNVALAEAAIGVLREEHPCTLRQLFYRLVSAGVLPSTGKPHYARLGNVLTRLREAEAVPFPWIVDHVRATLKPSSWSGLSDFSETVREVYRKDLWCSQSVHVEVFCEKDAIAGTLQRTIEAYDVPLRVCRGYVSVSFAGEIAAEWQKITKPIYAYYIGDHDASGLDIERDLVAKLERYSDRRRLIEGWGFGRIPEEARGAVFAWGRLAIDEDDIDAFDLLPQAVKLSDRRAASFLEEHGGRCAEVDALPPSELRRRVEHAIARHIDPDAWERLRLVEETEREAVASLSAKLGAEKAKLDSVSEGGAT